jgi:hypothetical protein
MDESPRIRIIIIEAQSETVIGEVLRELGTAEKMRGIYVEKVENMGDIYNVSGQAGAVGSNAKSEKDTFIQAAQPVILKDQITQLAMQLNAVRLSMKERATATPTATALNFPVLYALMSGSWACVACWSRCGRSGV